MEVYGISKGLVKISKMKWRYVIYCYTRKYFSAKTSTLIRSLTNISSRDSMIAINQTRSQKE